MKCDYCELKERKEAIIYQDDEVVLAVKDTALTPGQITVFPRQHFTIMELVPDEVLAKCAAIANKAGVALFESIGAHGTNVIVQNGIAAGQGVPHFALEIIPRRENDNLPLQWQPQQLSEEEMDTAYLMLKEEGEKIVGIGKQAEKRKSISAGNSNNKVIIVDEEGKENYMLKSLRRMP